MLLDALVIGVLSAVIAGAFLGLLHSLMAWLGHPYEPE